MRVGIRLSGIRELEAALRGHPERVAKATQQSLEMSARGLCVAYGAATNPPDAGGEWAAEGFRKRIDREVARVYPTRDDVANLYRLMVNHAAHLAGAWYHAVKSGNTKVATRLLRAARLPQGGAAVAGLKGQRTAKKGRVDGRKTPLALVRPAEQGKLAKAQRGLVGAAKAGWHQAAKGIGGRVRRNLVDSATGARSTAEAFPSYVRKVSNKFKGKLGGAVVTRGKVSVFSNVRHAAAALEPRHKATAESNAAVTFRKAIAAAVEAETNKRFRRTA